MVVPVYNGEPFLKELVERLISSLDPIGPFEIVLVNDSSPDRSWEVIKRICEQHSNVKGFHLSRNFGQHYAISAGLSESKGEWIVVMDCDLQDKSEEITKFIDRSKEGFDVVLGVRQDRKDGMFKKLYSKIFYSTLSWLTGVDYNHKIANFGMYHRKVINAVLDMNDSIRYFPAMVKWVGFKTTTVEVEHGKREVGKSAYNFKRMLHLAMDIILSYSDKPIRMAIKFGLLISLLSMLAAVIALVQRIFGLITVPGYASIVISIWLFGGLIIALLGLVGLYVSKTFQQTKDRPRFIISEKING